MGAPAGPPHAPFDPRLPRPRHSWGRDFVRHHGSVAGAASLHARSAGAGGAAAGRASPRRRAARRAPRQPRLGRLSAKVRTSRPHACSAPHAPSEIELSAIEVRELNPPAGEEPVHWRLLTTHDVETIEQALTVIGWYRQRWHVEQLFRTVKRQCLDLRERAMAEGEPLEKLAVIALIAACQTMQLVLARASPSYSQPASHVFDDRELQVLAGLQARLQGRTVKQQNPYPPGTLAWAAWSIARLGGWTGYGSDKSTGPITMRDGLERFRAIVQGYFLYEECVPKLALQGEGKQRDRCAKSLKCK